MTEQSTSRLIKSARPERALNIAELNGELLKFLDSVREAGGAFPLNVSLVYSSTSGITFEATWEVSQ